MFFGVFVHRHLIDGAAKFVGAESHVVSNTLAASEKDDWTRYDFLRGTNIATLFAFFKPYCLFFHVSYANRFCQRSRGPVSNPLRCRGYQALRLGGFGVSPKDEIHQAVH